MTDLKCPNCGAGPEWWQMVEEVAMINRGAQLSEDGTTLIFSASAEYSDAVGGEWCECSHCLTKIDLPEGLDIEYS